MFSTMARAILALILLAGVGALAACNTVAGFGQDIQNGAHDVQQYL